MTQSNAHIVDQLADIKAKIKALQDLESALKTQISREIGDGSCLVGDDWIAEQTLTTRKGGLDEAKLVLALGDLAPYRKADIAVVTIRTVLKSSRAA
jgi:hypothetical protein